MPTVHLTARSIRSLKPAAAARVDYWDTTLPGFGLRVTERGSRSWTVFYRHRGRMRRLTLGRYPALSLASARASARTLLNQAKLGADPAGAKLVERSRDGDTVTALVDEYAKRAQRKRSWPEERRILENEILPAWRHRLVREIRRRDVRALVDEKAETAPVMANRLLACISGLLNFGVDREWLDANPAYRLRKPGQETTRDRVLTRDELRALWAALGETSATNASGESLPRLTGTLNDAFRVMLLTGQRMGEVCRMRWSDVDLAACWWTIPSSDTKNGDDHRVPLTAPVLEILKRRQAEGKRSVSSTTYVFSKQRSPRSRSLRPPRDSSVAARAKKAASHLSRGLFVERDGNLEAFAFRAHDLRRSAASLMAGAGISREHIAHVLNHRSVTRASVTAIYDRYSYDREKRNALNRWARLLEEITSKDSGLIEKVAYMTARSARGNKSMTPQSSRATA